MTIYDSIVERVAADLRHKTREAALAGRFDINVWLIPADHVQETNPRVVVSAETPGNGAICIRPPHFQRWCAVSYANMHSVLWQALRREPVLPIYAERKSA